MMNIFDVRPLRSSIFKKVGGSAAALAVILMASSTAQALPAGMEMQEYISGLKFPVTIAPTSNGEILVAEKFGTVRLIRDDKLVDQAIASVDVTAQNEAGLIGITPMPDYADSGEFLILYTPDDPLDKIFVSRMRLEGDKAKMLDERWIELPSRANTDRHYGGNMKFSPDGYLFVTQGELRQRELAQDPQAQPGSVHRYNVDATIPEDNPFGEDNSVYAYGFRNPFDLDFDKDGGLYVNGNGEDSTDEINYVEAGKNYGWPLVQGHCDNFPVHEPCQDAELFTDPAFEFRTTVGPTGMVIYDGEMFPELVGDVLMTGWHSNLVHRLTRAPEDSQYAEGALVQLDSIYHAGGDLGLTDVKVAQDGAILVVFAGPQGGEIRRIIATEEGPGGDNNSPGNNSPGNNDPGNNDPGNNKPGNNDPGNHRPGDEEEEKLTGSRGFGCSAAGQSGGAPLGTVLLSVALGAAVCRIRRD